VTVTVLLGELARVVAYGGIGMVFGFVVGFLVNDGHRLSRTLLEGDDPMPTSQARRTRERRIQLLQTTTVVVVMIAMLLTGLSWMQTERTNTEQDRRECRRLSEVSLALQGRTSVYKEKAIPEQQLWRELRREIITLTGSRTNPAVQAIEEYLKSQRLYVKHLADNPYPDPEDCG